MGHFYFIRHGQTTWNIENKICGATDVPLTVLGHRQAMEAGQQILKEGIKAALILHSPLIRARETAEHISAATGIPTRVENRLIEQNFGSWEGKPRASQDFKKSKETFANSNITGESHLPLAQRIYNLLDEIKEDSDKTYILVAHNAVSRSVHSYFHDMTNYEYANFRVGNCQIVRYDFD